MKAFVTGGSGFIGRRLISRLVARGYEVYALARSERSAALVTAQGAASVRGDLHNLEVLRKGMTGCDVVFHSAADYTYGRRNTQRMEQTNVKGTANVLTTAFDLGIPKIVYTSTVGVFGDTHGAVVDESYFNQGQLATEYERTKWQAHYRVALPLIESGAPIIIVMPGAVYGPADTSIIGEMMTLYYRGLFPVFPAPETALTYAHVDDVAEGHILAAEKGKIGESYVLAGPAATFQELAVLWAKILGRRPPAAYIPAHWLRPFAPLVGELEKVLPVPRTFSEEILLTMGATYLATPAKANRELGWQTRSLSQGMTETFDYLMRRAPGGVNPSQRRVLAVGTLASTAVLFLFLWMLSRRRK